jgi:glucose-1-phosphate thymidylyltransferase
MPRKGIILAGGKGTRLYPLTYSISKQVLPIYDKPLLLYPIQTMLDAGVDHIVFIVSPDQFSVFNNLIKKLALPVNYNIVIQTEPEGIPQAFILAEEYINNSSVVLALGDNIFYGEGLNAFLQSISSSSKCYENVIFGYKVKNPSAYGVAKLDSAGNILQVVEKPVIAPSSYAIPGLYFFDKTVFSKARNCKKSTRGEYEITDVINQYIKEKNILFKPLSNETAWFDCGNIDDLLDAGNFVKAIQTRTNNIIGYDINERKI